jgi:hypothetical protein
MAKSSHAETTWGDIGEALSFLPVAWLGFLPGCLLEGSAEAIEKFSQRETKPSPVSFLVQPLKTIAGAIDRAGSIVSSHEGFLIGSGIAAIAPALFAGSKAALALGFSWPGLTAGGHFLAMAGAALGGAGVALAAYPFAAFAVVCALTASIAVPQIARDIPKIWRAWCNGLHDSLAWRPGRNAAIGAPAPAAQTASAPGPAPKPEPEPEQSSLRKYFSVAANAIKGQDEAERIRFLKSLRRKYPAEFADALRLESTDPELRKDIQVKKPLSFKARRRGLQGEHL